MGNFVMGATLARERSQVVDWDQTPFKYGFRRLVGAFKEKTLTNGPEVRHLQNRISDFGLSPQSSMICSRCGLEIGEKGNSIRRHFWPSVRNLVLNSWAYRILRVAFRSTDLRPRSRVLCRRSTPATCSTARLDRRSHAGRQADMANARDAMAHR